MPREPQPWTFAGKRGDHVVSGLKVRAIYSAVLNATVAHPGASGIDEHALAQEVCCNVERALGIYPNCDVSLGLDDVPFIEKLEDLPGVLEEFNDHWKGDA